MFLDIILLVIGLTLIVYCADLLTKGAVRVASSIGISELVVGLTVVAIGTSAPEITVSITSALKGESQMAVGNVIGSNLFNSLFIIGITALVAPIPLSKSNVKKNIPSVIVASLLLLVMTLSVFGVSAMPATIGRFGGIVLLAVFAIFMWLSIKGQKRSSASKENQVSKRKLLLPVVMIIAGLVGLVYGGDLFLENAIKIARSANVSEYIISVTLIAGGTSLPELAACVAAARRGRSQLALGNVIGSNVSNILLVLGVSATITPLELKGVSSMDISLVIISAIMLIITPFTFKTARIDRIEGLIFTAVYLGYIFLLLA